MKYRNMLALVAMVLLLVAGQAVSAQTPDTSSSSPNAGSQERGRGHGRHGGFGRGEFDRADLNLTADQKTKLKALHESTRQQVEALRSDSTLSTQDKEAKLRTIHESSRQQLQAILTPEQQQLMKNERHESQGRRGFGHGRDPFADLGLTTEQRSQIETIHKSSQDQLNALRNDSTLSQEQKDAKAKSIMQSTHQQVLGLLTPEQQQKLKARHDDGPGRFGGRGRRGDRGGVGAPPANRSSQP